MSLRITPENKLQKIIVIGDRVLIKPRKTEERTRTGLYLPATVQDREEVSSGYIIKAGPGYAIPYPADGEDEP